MSNLTMPNLTLPKFNSLDPIQYIVDLENLQKKINDPKKKQILKFINSWMGKKNDDDKFKSFDRFKNIYFKEFPNNDNTKIFLCKYFEVYNQDFKLNLEYNDKLFTTYNALYMLKLMLNTLHYDLKKSVFEKKTNKETIKKTKLYTIIYKKH